MDVEQIVGMHGRGELASRVLRDWQPGPATQAERLEALPAAGA